MTGDFDIEDSLQFLNECLPDLPLATQATSLTIGYKSSFLGTLLNLKLTEQGINVVTDNLSVLAIIKDSLTKEASMRKIRVNVAMSEIEYSSAVTLIETVYPMMSH